MDNSTKDRNIPLLDEVNELIEKERTLLSLKLLEQKQESEEWKLKYESLVTKVSDNVEENADFGILALAADIATDSQESKASQDDINFRLKSQKLAWILDLSDLKLDINSFDTLCKSVFGKKNNDQSDMKIVKLSHCELTDDYTTGLSSILRSTNVEALDLSNNCLSETFLLQTMSILKDRRRSPQYLLLAGNDPMSATAKNFPAILDTLTQHMWGLTVSLPDFAENIMSHLTPAAKKKSSAPNKDYSETVRHPMKAGEFLKALNTLLDPTGTALEGTLSGGTAALKKTDKSKVKPSKTSKTAVVGRSNPLQSLSVLGLTLNQLSKRSIALLENTLHISASSLMDLDLSFAYVGFVGTDMLKRVLSNKDCQIVRLALVGNGIGDEGVAALCSALPANKSLTYLDLRSNHITNVGLRAVERPLGRSAVLHLLDLRNNLVTAQAAVSVTQALGSLGVSIRILFPSFDSVALLAGHSATPNSGLTLFQHAHKVSRTMALDKPTLLFSLDFGKINGHHPDHVETAKCVEWEWRFVQTSTALNVVQRQKGSLVKSSKSNRQQVSTAGGEDVFLLLNSYAVHYEVRVPSSSSTVTRTGVMDNSSCQTRRFLHSVEGGGDDWIKCKVLLRADELPAKGTVDIYVLLLDREGNRPANPAKSCIAFEGINFSVSAAPEQHSYLLNSGELNEVDQLVGGLNLGSHAQAQLLSEDKGALLHCRRVVAELGSISFSFDLRLRPSKDDDHDTSAASHDFPAGDVSGTQHDSLGFEWFLTCLSPSGHSHTLASGTSSNSADQGHSSEDSSAAHRLLSVWRWQSFAVTTAPFAVRVNDVLVLTAKVVSSQYKYPPALLKKCSVAQRSFRIHSSATSTDNQTSTGNIYGATEAFGLLSQAVGAEDWSAFAVLNDQSREFPM